MNLHRYASLLPAVAMLTLTACATGSAIVTGNTRDPVAPEQVKIYLDPPAAFETIGLVKATSGAGWTQQGSVEYAIEELKKQAAKLGANGVLLVSSGETTSSVVGTHSNGAVYAVPVTGQTVQGRAIFVKPQ